MKTPGKMSRKETHKLLHLIMTRLCKNTLVNGLELHELVRSAAFTECSET